MKRNSAFFLLTGVLVAALSISPSGFSQTAAGGRNALDRVLGRMEAAGKGFRTFRTQFIQKKYIAILAEFDTPESGELIYARARDGSALVRQEVKVPAPRILTIREGTLTVYQPRIGQATIMNLGKNKDKAEYIALGIGQSPKDLQETFDIEYKGTDQVGKDLCSVLLLRPKSSATAAYFSEITLWVKDSNGLPVQQKLQEPSGDYLLVTFSQEQLNTKVPAPAFEQKLPKGVEIQRIQ